MSPTTQAIMAASMLALAACSDPLGMCGNEVLADVPDPTVPLRVRPVWASDRMLRLIYDSRLRTFTREGSVAGVQIVYPYASPKSRAAENL